MLNKARHSIRSKSLTLSLVFSSALFCIFWISGGLIGLKLYNPSPNVKQSTATLKTLPLLLKTEPPPVHAEYHDDIIFDPNFHAKEMCCDKSLVSRVPKKSNCGKTLHLSRHVWTQNASKIALENLSHIFVVISFHYNPSKLVYLEAAIKTIKTFQTRVDVIVVTDNSQATASVLAEWNLGQDVESDSSKIQVEIEPFIGSSSKRYALLWKHREVMEKAFSKNIYSSFLHIEDDTDISWNAMLAWSLDASVLEPLNFTRGFLRTEYNFKGVTAAQDVGTAMEVANFSLHHITSNAACPSRAASLHYAQIVNSVYHGCWIVSKHILGKWIRSGLWSEKDVETVKLPWPLQHLCPGCPERTNLMHTLLDSPPGFIWNSLIPYDPKTGSACKRARIRHLRNGYAKPENQGFSSIDANRVFLPSNDCNSGYYEFVSQP